MGPLVVLRASDHNLTGRSLKEIDRDQHLRERTRKICELAGKSADCLLCARQQLRVTPHRS